MCISFGGFRGGDFGGCGLESFVIIHTLDEWRDRNDPGEDLDGQQTARELEEGG